MQRRVVDSNFLRDGRLQEYLKRSHSNFVVLTDFVAMEIHKKNAAVTVPKSLKILCEFPRQVVVTKSSNAILRTSPRGAGLAARLIDTRQSAGFAKYCRILPLATDSTHVSKQIIDNQTAAERHMAEMLVESAELPRLFKDMAGRFSQNEIAILRRREPYPRELQFKLMDLTFEGSRELHRTLNLEPRFMPERYLDAVNTFPFRYSLCATLLYVHWIIGGRQLDVRPEKTRNDLVDMNVAAMATYFDGVLTSDGKLAEIFKEANWILRQMRAAMAWFKG